MSSLSSLFKTVSCHSLPPERFATALPLNWGNFEKCGAWKAWPCQSSLRRTDFPQLKGTLSVEAVLLLRTIWQKLRRFCSHLSFFPSSAFMFCFFSWPVYRDQLQKNTQWLTYIHTCTPNGWSDEGIVSFHPQIWWFVPETEEMLIRLSVGLGSFIQK